MKKDLNSPSDLPFKLTLYNLFLSVVLKGVWTPLSAVALLFLGFAPLSLTTKQERTAISGTAEKTRPIQICIDRMPFFLF